MIGRLDQSLLERGLVRSRTQALDLIRRRLVTVDGVIARKGGQSVGKAAVIEIASDETQMVSRGGVKLRAALDAFAFDPGGRVCLDVGASTGGFTQLLLERGARRVVAIDVGRAQLDPALAADPRVDAREGFDARQLTADVIGGPVGAITADLSFIALSKALGPSLAAADDGAWLVALVKPQFEVGRDGVGKGGIVRDPSLRESAVTEFEAWLEHSGWRVAGRIASPITGGSGNVEFLVGASRR